MAEIDNARPSSVPPRRVSSLANLQTHHRRFPSVRAYVEELGGDKKCIIEKILIANNGVAAVKAIRSIRRWAYDVFGDERAISFVVMATPEDLRANAEYIRMGDTIVDVPGGTNNNNYANVTLIVELARLHGVHAVWAGWGHASENPLLPNTLAASSPPIKFIGPKGSAMRALGDKIGSTIIAQSAGVPCIAWNGMDVKATYDKATGCLPDEAFDAATVKSAQEAQDAAERIGFPVMIKASEGGGGKGIRKVACSKEVQESYGRVCSEVPGSPVFVMKLADRSRHLEVQLLADEYGTAVALNGRDCSVQRRHQKIIEEGPPIACESPVVWRQMEQAAIDLAVAVGYANAGTVEYLYSESDAKFYFLELNPRLQVEHPVTEMITGVNLPACQLQVAMGLPLSHIPDLRVLYGAPAKFEESYPVPLDFATTPRLPPKGHCIAVRITAENAQAGFKPTSGGIRELNFRSTPNVWGYFSMDGSGSIHEFADSQFGHLFASGSDRESARRNMVLALKELSIRGDISTTVDYISRLIELEEFVNNEIDTNWLDGIIKEGGVTSIAAALSALSGDDTSTTSSGSTSCAQKRGGLRRNVSFNSASALNTLPNDSYAVIGAVVTAHLKSTKSGKQFVEGLRQGRVPPSSLLEVTSTAELTLEGVKYSLHCQHTAADEYRIHNTHSPTRQYVTVPIRTLSDGGFLLTLPGHKSQVAYLTSSPDEDPAAAGMRMDVGGVTVTFSPDYDPTLLRADVAGKLIKRLVPQGAKVTRGTAYAEIEVMKMVMPLKVDESGTIDWKSNEGAALRPGELLATLELDNPATVVRATVFKEELSLITEEKEKETQEQNDVVRPHALFRSAVSRLRGGMEGYVLDEATSQKVFADLATAVRDPGLPLYEVQEKLSVLNGRIDAQLYNDINTIVNSFKETYEGGERQERFPAEKVEELLVNHAVKMGGNYTAHAAFVTLTSPVREALAPYITSTNSPPPALIGGSRALAVFLDLLRTWISTERWFNDAPSDTDAVDNLRKAHRDEEETVLTICRAHAGLDSISARLVMQMLDQLGQAAADAGVAPESVAVGAEGLLAAVSCLSEIGAMDNGRSKSMAKVALKARKLLLQESMSSIRSRKDKVKQAVEQLLQSQTCEDVIETVPFSDIFFSVMEGLSEEGALGLFEIYARNLYHGQSLKSAKRDTDGNSFSFSFTPQPQEKVLSTSNTLTSMSDLTRLVSHSSIDLPSLLQDEIAKGGIGAPQDATRTVVFHVISKITNLDNPQHLTSLLSAFPSFATSTNTSPSSSSANLLHILVKTDRVTSDQETSSQIHSILSKHSSLFHRANLRRITVLLGYASAPPGAATAPATFTYRAAKDFTEDELFRNVEPTNAYHLDLTRLATNFSVKSLSSGNTVDGGHVHLYQATPKKSACASANLKSLPPRIVVRGFSFLREPSALKIERIVVDALNALDAHGASSTDDGHLFLNLVNTLHAADTAATVVDPAVLESIVVSILRRHAPRITRLGIAEVEIRVVCRLAPDSPPIAIRIVASNPTGYVLVTDSYVEAAGDNDEMRVFKTIGGMGGVTSAPGAGIAPGAWEGKSVAEPYPLTRPFDAQRKAALKASDTLYCYDLPALFEAAVERQWSLVAQKKSDASTEGPTTAPTVTARPLVLMYTKELVVRHKDTSADAGGKSGWTMQDYLNGDLEMVEAQGQRGPGMNDVGMVAWLMTLNTPEYPNGRQIILIANDITHKAGSFGTREDVVFKLASQYARTRRLPRLYVAANSGARIGTAEKVKKTYKVAFKDPVKPENGFDYLYVDGEELGALEGEIVAEEVEGEEGVYRITDIVGSEPDLGVENLKGSGLIAGETSSAYNDIFTMTIVLGRTVGIGAYLVRLGQRTIQKTTASPIILTGYQALNKLMGCDVYSTNDQLGGPGIMYSNGISHIVAPDHLRAISSAVDWLSYVPSVRGGLLPITDVTGIDSIERKIAFTPRPNVPYDPRHLIAGGEDDDGVFQSGFFDMGSFTETLAGWAKSVVVGRARLGGIPVGVVATENRTAEAIKPADPADVTASEAVIKEAGCVWFPNSAYKTAQAINDFRTEDLPLMIFANWRGFSGGQRDMFDEVLKYGSLIVDAFVAYEQPVFVLIPPYAEIRGGAWVVLDASINSSVMELYATAKTARGGVLEANGAASVKYRLKDLIPTMHRLDDKLKALDAQLTSATSETKMSSLKVDIKMREQALLPVYEQIAVQFCDLHDTPGRMKAVGVIEKEVEWEEARTFFFWRLRRKLAEFDLRRKIMEAANLGRGVAKMAPLDASGLIKQWFSQSHSQNVEEEWKNDRLVLSWMAENFVMLEGKIVDLTREFVTQEVFQVLTAGGNTEVIGTQGIVGGLARACATMSKEQRDNFKKMVKEALEL